MLGDKAQNDVLRVHQPLTHPRFSWSPRFLIPQNKSSDTHTSANYFSHGTNLGTIGMAPKYVRSVHPR